MDNKDIDRIEADMHKQHDLILHKLGKLKEIEQAYLDEWMNGPKPPNPSLQAGMLIVNDMENAVRKSHIIETMNPLQKGFNEVLERFKGNDHLINGYNRCIGKEQLFNYVSHVAELYFSPKLETNKVQEACRIINENIDKGKIDLNKTYHISDVEIQHKMGINGQDDIIDNTWKENPELLVHYEKVLDSLNKNNIPITTDIINNLEHEYLSINKTGNIDNSLKDVDDYSKVFTEVYKKYPNEEFNINNNKEQIKLLKNELYEGLKVNIETRFMNVEIPSSIYLALEKEVNNIEPNNLNVNNDNIDKIYEDMANIAIKEIEKLKDTLKETKRNLPDGNETGLRAIDSELERLNSQEIELKGIAIKTNKRSNDLSEASNYKNSIKDKPFGRFINAIAEKAKANNVIFSDYRLEKLRSGLENKKIDKESISNYTSNIIDKYNEKGYKWENYKEPTENGVIATYKDNKGKSIGFIAELNSKDKQSKTYFAVRVDPDMKPVEGKIHMKVSYKSEDLMMMKTQVQTMAANKVCNDISRQLQKLNNNDLDKRNLNQSLDL